jgi:MerR family transcriptional regulator/heat shock protein HspR
MENAPVFPIGVVSELLNVHPETIRVWERQGIIKPQRRSGKRFYSELDMERLQFIQRLIVEEGLNLPAIRHYLQLYPCWQSGGCPACMHRSEVATCTKPCWKEEGTYCQAYGNEITCANCEFRNESKEHKAQQTSLDSDQSINATNQ